MDGSLVVKEEACAGENICPVLSTDDGPSAMGPTGRHWTLTEVLRRSVGIPVSQTRKLKRREVRPLVGGDGRLQRAVCRSEGRIRTQ